MQLLLLTLTSLLTTTLALPSLSTFTRRQSTPPAWTIQSFTRNCPEPSTCTYDFLINQNDGSTPVECTIVDTGAPATTQAWYGVACSQDAGYSISWGWDYQNDFVVMTVVDEASQMEAFFGYDDPNSATSYPDNGPNAAQAV